MQKANLIVPLFQSHENSIKEFNKFGKVKDIERPS
jgi:hypothetical protein